MFVIIFTVWCVSSLQLSESLTLQIEGNKTSFSFPLGVVSEIKFYVRNGEDFRIFVQHKAMEKNEYDTKCIVSQSASKGCRTTNNICRCPNDTDGAFSLNKTFQQTDAGLWMFKAWQHDDPPKTVNVTISDLRLTGTGRTSSDMGRVEMENESGRFGTVCVNDEKTAAVICRQLNLPSDYPALTDGWLFGGDKSPLVVAAFICDGSEKSLAECGRNNLTKDCYSKDVGVFCSSYRNLFIVSGAERYPFMEGGNRALRCVAPRKYLRVSEYTWSFTAGGRPYGDLLIFENLTREYSGRNVSCLIKYRDSASDSDAYIWSASHELKVYYQPLIRITWADDIGKQQKPLSNISKLSPGQNVTLWCEADSNPPPVAITWSGRVSSMTGELRITAAEHVRHSGLYTCTVITETVDDDERLPLKSSYQLTLSVQGLHLTSLSRIYCKSQDIFS